MRWCRARPPARPPPNCLFLFGLLKPAHPINPVRAGRPSQRVPLSCQNYGYLCDFGTIPTLVAQDSSRRLSPANAHDGWLSLVGVSILSMKHHTVTRQAPRIITSYLCPLAIAPQTNPRESRRGRRLASRSLPTSAHLVIGVLHGTKPRVFRAFPAHLSHAPLLYSRDRFSVYGSIE